MYVRSQYFVCNCSLIRALEIGSTYGGDKASAKTMWYPEMYLKPPGERVSLHPYQRIRNTSTSQAQRPTWASQHPPQQAQTPSAFLLAMKPQGTNLALSHPSTSTRFSWAASSWWGAGNPGDIMCYSKSQMFGVDKLSMKMSLKQHNKDHTISILCNTLY